MKFRIENLTGTTEGYKLIFELTTVKELRLFDIVSHQDYEHGSLFTDFLQENQISGYGGDYTIVNDNLVTVAFNFYRHATGGGRTLNSDDSDVIKTAIFIQEWMNEDKLNKYYAREY